MGGSHLDVVVRDHADLPAAVRAVSRVCDGEPLAVDVERRVQGAVTDRVAALTEVARTLRDEGVAVEDIGLRRPSLDDVFLRLTGQTSETKETTEATGTTEATKMKEEVAA